MAREYGFERDPLITKQLFTIVHLISHGVIMSSFQIQQLTTTCHQLAIASEAEFHNQGDKLSRVVEFFIKAQKDKAELLSIQTGIQPLIQHIEVIKARILSHPTLDPAIKALYSKPCKEA